MASSPIPRSTTPVPPPLHTAFIPDVKDSDVPPTPPPAYFAGPNPHRFIRTGSWGAQEALSPTSQALQEQYTEYFTDLFTQWVGVGILFWKYGIPTIKWTLFFWIRNFGGWSARVWFLGWFMVWVAPGLYIGIVGMEIQDVPQGTFKAVMKDPKSKAIFWGTWGSVLILKFASLWWVSGMTNWWLCGGLMSVWLSTFGI